MSHRIICGCNQTRVKVGRDVYTQEHIFQARKEPHQGHKRGDLPQVPQRVGGRAAWGRVGPKPPANRHMEACLLYTAHMAPQCRVHSAPQNDFSQQKMVVKGKEIFPNG